MARISFPLITAAAALMLQALPAAAQPAMGGPGPMMGHMRLTADERWLVMLHRMDASKAGFITLKDWQAAAGKRFDERDTKKAGKIPVADFFPPPPPEMEAKMMERVKARAGDKAAEAMAKIKARREERQTKILTQLDPNKTGFITREAVVQQAAERFKKMDPNNDGKITFEEFKAQAEKMKAERQKRPAQL